MLHDIVYFCKEGRTNEELTYSLRSVVTNFLHRKVWIYGGLPDNLECETHVRLSQLGNTKWERVTRMLRKAASNDSITESFYLFNDDFFVMKPTKFMVPYYDGDLYRRIVMIENRHNNRASAYSMALRKTANELEERGLDCLNYAVHMPMLVNRKKVLEVLDEFPNCPMFRALYGNYCKVGGERKSDVKVYSETTTPLDKNETFLSTDDKAWKRDTMGVATYIKESFPLKSRYEK